MNKFLIDCENISTKKIWFITGVSRGFGCIWAEAALMRGDPQAMAEAILKIVDAEDPPLRCAVGSGVLPMARAAYADRLATWEAWEAASNAAQGKSKRGAEESF